MQSRISCFDKTLFRKDMTRFFPAWLCYSVFLLLSLLLMLDANTGSPIHLARAVGEYVSLSGLFSCVYALLCAQLLFGDLYQSRMCNAIHAMPLRRETMFFTHCLAGLCFFFLPNGVMSLLLLPFLEEYWVMSGYFFLCGGLAYLFFFGAAVFAVQCVGSRFAMAAVYGLINFLSMLVLWLVNQVFVPLLPGIVLQADAFVYYSPVVKLMSTAFLEVGKAFAASVTTRELWYFAAVGGAGLVFAAAGLALYRRRDLEGAGDFIVVRPVAPVFLVLFTLAVGVVVQLMFSLFAGGEKLVFLYIGMAVGFFTGQMLLRRTPRVFHRRVLAGFAVFAAAVGVCLALTVLDPAGVTRWVPEADRVERVTWGTVGLNGEVTLTDPREIEDILAIHRAAVEEKYGPVENGYGAVRLHLRYTLKNGRTAVRQYTVPSGGQTGGVLRAYLSRPEAVFGFRPDKGKTYGDALENIYIYSGDTQPLSKADSDGLLAAILKDCEEGHMAQEWGLHANAGKGSVASMELSFRNTALGNSPRCYLEVFQDSENTIAWLEENGYMELLLTNGWVK